MTLVPLAHRSYGSGDPTLVILHGLLGSSRNWHQVAMMLGRRYEVLVPDLRNHGDSPHAERHDHESMVGDVVAWLAELGRSRVALLGHSMGGKVAMALACRFPDLVERLIVVDIAPRDYAPTSVELEAVRALDLSTVTRREDAEERLEESIPDHAMRQFLLTNLRRSGEGRFVWKVNLEVIAESLPDVRRSPLSETDRCELLALFIIGGRSRYVTSSDHASIRAHFPRGRIEIIEESGHNPHVDAREHLVTLITDFLDERSGRTETRR